MRFRLTNTVHNPGISDPAELELHLTQPRITVKLRRSDDNTTSHKSRHDWIAEAEVDRSPNPRLFKMLLADKERLEAARKEKQLVRGDETPAQLIEFGNQVNRELAEAIRRVLNTIRWRLGYRGHHNPVRSTKGVRWLADNGEWYPLHTSLHASFESIVHHDVTPRLHDQFATIINSAASEPVAHALFREAWQQRTSNMRSALLIGVAAAEVGAKTCIATLQPESAWLIENMPSPSLETLLRDYFPTLPAATGARQLKAMPKDVIETVRKAVRMRNQLAHAKPPHIDTDDLDYILETVSDLLWYFDYICGHVWALSFVKDPLHTLLVDPK